MCDMPFETVDVSVSSCRCERFVLLGFYFASLGPSGIHAYDIRLLNFNAAVVGPALRPGRSAMSSAAQTAAKVAQRTYRDAKSVKERWIIKEVSIKRDPALAAGRVCLWLTIAMQYGACHVVPCRPIHFTPLLDWDVSVLFFTWVDLRWVPTLCELLIALVRHNSRHGSR